MKKDILKSKITKVDSKKKYSFIQYFFWMLSGCEINILKDCPTDYNRQAGIGFTIFMTTLLAFFSGGYAGWYFGESITTAIVFGLLWSALIFSIDRSMVVTLKKDPTLKEQKFWAPLISRGIMALLIAFIISIPLELLIFQENIELHMEKFKLNQTYEVQQAAIRNEDITSKERILKRDSINASQLAKDLAIGEPQGNPSYKDLKTDYNERDKEYQILRSNYYNAISARKKAENEIPMQQNIETNEFVKDKSSSEWRNFKRKEKEERTKRDAYYKFDKKGLEKAKKDKDKYLSDWKSKKFNEKEDLKIRVKNQTNDISNSLIKTDSIKGSFEDNIKDKKGFVLRFMILEDLAKRYKKVRQQVEVEDVMNRNLLNNTIDTTFVAINNSGVKMKWIDKDEYNHEGATIFFLLWLIRILFFTIEILPTIAKISTPLGAYDFAIYRKEKEIEEDLKNRADDYLEHQKKIRQLENNAHVAQTIEKNKIENELHANMLREIASAQNEVAKKQIEDFKKKHL
jgi:hypothetical protein